MYMTLAHNTAIARLPAVGYSLSGLFSTQAHPCCQVRGLHGGAGGLGSKSGSHSGPLTPVRPRHTSATGERIKEQTRNQEFLVSVLETTATKRDAKAYLQKYRRTLSKRVRTPGYVSPQAIRDSPLFSHQTNETQEVETAADDPIHVAIVQIRNPQTIDDAVLDGVAKTLSQLRTLGLLSLILVECGPTAPRESTREQSNRISHAINKLRFAGSRVLDGWMSASAPLEPPSSSPGPESSTVDITHALYETLARDKIPVIPSILYPTPPARSEQAIPGQSALTITELLAQLPQRHGTIDTPNSDAGLRPWAVIERIIILDPLGGIPQADELGLCHRFVNLAQEYSAILADLERGRDGYGVDTGASSARHIENLNSTNAALSLLPPTSSAIITTPRAAANSSSRIPPPDKQHSLGEDRNNLPAGVRTRRKKNPLIYNLLTDKPVYSSSLPLSRSGQARSIPTSGPWTEETTLLKRGVPVTIHPDPAITPWRPPVPGSPCLRLTDAVVDLDRLVYLIENSFGRPLDLQHYLARVNDRLAGIIIAGEYEGGAILTWERPVGLEHEAASSPSRMVPYLDKFAVLKSRQGSSGMADIVFNAMVRDCFPEGVCWRSRQDNPVNKWYFERSSGTKKLSQTNWTMFWTTPGIHATPVLADYEDVCRNVEPSWMDKKQPAD